MKKKKFAIIGNPIEHSLSPTLHNYWYEKYKINADYNLIEVKENNLKSSLQQELSLKSLK